MQLKYFKNYLSIEIYYYYFIVTTLSEQKMIIPVRCFTCGKVIGNKWQTYASLVSNPENSPQSVLDTMGLKRYCCRRMLLSHVNIIDSLLQKNKKWFFLILNSLCHLILCSSILMHLVRSAILAYFLILFLVLLDGSARWFC